MFPKGTEKCKKIGFILLSVALSILLLSVFASAYSNETVIVGSTVVNPGVSFSLPVFVDNITNIRFLSLDVLFNSSSVVIDDINGNSSSSVSDTQFYLNNSTGFANMTFAFDNLTSEDEIHVANLLFRSLVSGYYDIVLRNVSFSNDTTSLPADYVVNGSVRVNYPPVIGEIENKTVNVGSNLNFTLSATDQDDTNLSFGIEGLPAVYSLNSSNGSFSWTPVADDIGNHSANFSVFDGYASDFTYATIFVNEIEVPVIDNPPELQPIGNKSLNETEVLFFVIEANDPDSDPITFSADVLPGNSTLNVTSGEFYWVTGYSDAGEYIVEFMASSTDKDDLEMITIVVANKNRAPVLDYIGPRSVFENDLLEIPLSAADDDPEDVLKYSSNASFGNLSENIFTWTPDSNDSGIYSIEFNVTDGTEFDSEIVIINVSNVNNAPVLDEIGEQFLNETATLELILTANDEDPGDTLSYYTNATFGNLTDNVFTWTPDYNAAGTYVVEFTVNDSIDSDSQTVIINVGDTNRPPVLSPIDDSEINENESLSITLSASDLDNNSLTYSSNVSFGNISGNIFTWHTDFNDAGTYVAEFTVSDGADSDSKVVNITVNNVNRAPALNGIGLQSVFENDLLEITLSATELDSGDTLTYGSNASFGNLADYIFTWTPGFTDSGVYSVEFNVSDGSLVDSEIVTIFVNNVNNEPVLSEIGEQFVSENDTLTISLNATDADINANLNYSTNATFGDLTDNVFTWTPDYDSAGVHAVEFAVSDGIDSDSETVMINVANVNRAPVLSSIADVLTDENNPVSITLPGSDPDGNDLTYSSNVSFGDISGNVFTWTPDYDAAGVYTIEFSVSDESNSDSEIITITVNNVNRVPILSSPGSYTVNENSSLTITLNATDLDSEDTLSYYTNATFGNLTDNIFTWTPDYEKAGVYAIEFTASDGLDSDSEVAIITVNNVNRAPVLMSPGSDFVAENSSLVITLSANDPDTEDSLVYSHNATFGILEDKVFTWTPDYNSSGIHAIEFTVSDGDLSDSGVSIITVNNTNRAPFIQPISDELVNENEELIIVINGSDPDGDTLIYEKNIAFGTLNNNVFTWTPGYDDSGIYDVSFTVSDGNLSYTENLKIAVGNTNVPPNLYHIGGKTVDENQYLSFKINATDEDSGDTLTYSASGLPSGASFNDQTRQFSWTPTYNQSGTHNVVFEVNDGIFSDTELVQIVVNNVNIAPVLSSIGNRTVNENSELSFIVTATDHDRDSLVFLISNPSNIGSFNPITHEFSWVPGYDKSGTYNVTFTVSDGDLFDSETVYIEVLNINRAPELDYIGNKGISEAEELTFTITATDPDSDSIVYSATDVPDGADFDESTHVFTWTPDYDDSGTYDVTFTVSDGDLSDSETITISVGSVNRPPELSFIGDKTVTEGLELSFSINATDPDENDLTYSTSVLPDGADFDEFTHVFTWTPDYDQSGSYSIAFMVSDGILSDSESITLDVTNINRAPVMNYIENASVNENSELVISVSATDPDNEALSYSVTGKPEGSVFNSHTRELVWTPDHDASGEYEVTFTVSDGDLSDSQIVSITVNNVNRAPVLDEIGNKNVDENATLYFTLNAEDPDFNPLTYSATEVPDSADFDPLTREFTWTPVYGESGTYDVTFNVSDGDLSDSETITISVGLVNRAPELGSIGDKTISEGSELNFTISANDPDGNALEYTTSTLPDGASFDAVSHVFTWTPDYEQEGSYSIDFSVSDGSLADSETISIEVLNTNRAPVLSEIGNMDVAEGEEISFTIDANDPDSDTLSYSASGIPDDAVFNINTRTFVWTPGYDDSGNYEVTFSVSDGDLNDSESITITVGSVNRPPVLAFIGDKIIDENSELSFKITGTDLDQDDLTYSIQNKPVDAYFDEGTGQFSWTPDYEASGTYSVILGVSDGYLNDSETVTITVYDVNRAPVLDNIRNKQINEGEELSFTVSASDDDGDSLIYYSTGVPQGANFDPNTREFTWTPDFDDSGSYSVTFYVSDSYQLDSESIIITVGSVNRAPELEPIGDKTIGEGSEIRLTVSGSDPDSNDLTYSATGIPDGADFDEGTQEFVWIPDYDQSGTYNVTFSVSDGDLSDSETISIIVTSVNRAPELVPTGDIFVDENELLTISLHAGDEDEGDILHYSVIDTLENSAINASTGVFTWTPSYDDAGVHYVVFSVSDGQAKDTENVKITVYNVNRPPQIDIPSKVFVAENDTLVLDLNASDPDNTPLGISKDFASGSLHNGIFTWNTGYEDEGNYDVTFTVSDGELEVSQTVEIIVTGSNSAPVLYSISSVLFLVNELDTVTINLTAVDIDGDELTFSKNVSFGNISGNVFTWTPSTADSGIYYIIFTVSDGQLSDSKTAMVAVGNTNIPPSIVHMGTQYVHENETLEFIINATDPDNETLTYAVTGLPYGADFDNITGSFTWTPTYGQSGKYTIEFRASDLLYTAFDTVTVHVENVNRAPLFNSIPMYEVNETEQVKVNLSATDPDGDSISFSTDFDNGKIIGDKFVWETGYYDSGDYYILFNATDGDLYDSTTVHVKVNPTNMPPEIEYIGSRSIYENETLEFYVNATDADNDTLTYSLSGAPSGASFDPETRLFHWIPSYRQAGTYSVEFHVNDGKLNDSEAITIRVYDVDNKVTDYSGFSSSSSGGGGGGGGSSGAEDYNNVAYKDYSIKYVTQGQKIAFKFPNSENDLESVEFTALKAAGQVKAIIEILYDRSSLVSTNPPGNVYRYINIWVGDTKFNSGNYFSSAEVTFKVSKQWLEDNNADPASVKLYRYSSGSWSELKTSRIGNDVNNYYYKAQTPGFSPFAIASTGSTAILRSTIPESAAKSTKVTYESNAELNSIDVQDAEMMNKAVEQEPVSPFNAGIFFIGIIGILLIGSAIGYRSRNESPVLRRYYEAIHAFVLGIRNAAEWTSHKLSSESMHKDYAALSVKWNEIKTADYKAIYEKKMAEIKERQK